MVNKFQIPLDSLKNNNIYKFENVVYAKELDIPEENELKFTKPIKIDGKAYITDDTLILTLNISFFIEIPCSSCNKFFEKSFIIKNLHITEKVLKINSTYDYKDEIRNACFLEIPSYIQCNENCSEINDLKKYLNVKKENFPFSNL